METKLGIYVTQCLTILFYQFLRPVITAHVDIRYNVIEAKLVTFAIFGKIVKIEVCTLTTKSFGG